MTMTNDWLSAADFLDSKGFAMAASALTREFRLRPFGLSDADLLAAYQRTDGEPGNPEADALAAEIKRRNLNL
jgi:hypothetical protein